MSCGVTSRIYSGCKMLSVHQCMRNTLIKNKEILIYREFITLQNVSKPLSLVKFSHHRIKGRTNSNVQGQSHFILKRHQFISPLGCVSYSNDSNKPKVEKNVDGKKEVELSIYQKLKKMFKEYWYVVVPVHIITSCVWYGGFYYLAVSGIDIPALMETLGAPESWIQNLQNSKAGNFVLAYTLYKVATPVRYTVTVGGTTISINFLKKWGWIKPVPNKEQFKKMYEEQKGVFKDFKASYQDKMQVTKNELMKTKNEIKQQYIEAKEELHKSLKDTRDGFKEGVKGGAEEWRAIGGGISKSVRDMFPSKK